MNCWSESEITVKKKKTQNILLTRTYLMVTIEPGVKFKKNKIPPENIVLGTSGI